MSRLFGALVGAGLVVLSFVATDMAYSRNDIVFENASWGELARSAFLLFIFLCGGYAGVRILVAALSED
jgi:hypothetical protein